MKCLPLIVVLGLAGCGESHAKPTILAPLVTCHARAGGQLPDPKCTPGSINPAVTQANIKKTICKPGYTKTIRPPTSYTNSLKKSQIQWYGYSDKNPHDYEEDHLISLELGGNPWGGESNLWPEYPRSPNPKDTIENRLHREVCLGKITLATARHEIATDWRTAK